MWKQITNLNGDEIYLIISLWIFFVFFVAVAIMLLTMKKDFVHYMERIPLEDGEEDVENENEKSPE